MEKRLRQDRVTRYALLTAEIDKLKKEQEKQRGKIIRLMNNGYTCPRFGPYLVVLSEQVRRPIAWKEEWVKQAKKVFGPAWRKVMKGVMSRAPEIKTPLLLVRVNPDGRQRPQQVIEINHRGAA